MPLYTAEVVSLSDHHRLSGGGPTRIEAKRADYAARGVLGHLEIEFRGEHIEARWYQSVGDTFELVASVRDDQQLTVSGPVPFTLVPAGLRSWLVDQIRDRDRQFDAQAALLERQAAQLGQQAAVIAAQAEELRRMRTQLGNVLDPTE